MICVLIAGQMGVGKTTVANLLASEINAVRVSVRQALAEVLGLGEAGGDRRTLQEQGSRLDRRTRGRWLADFLTERMEREEDIVVDSVRTKRQCLPVLELISDSVLIYLDGSVETRRGRFVESAALDSVKQSMPFDRASRYSTEVEVVELKPIAQLAIPTDSLTASEVVEEIIRYLGRSETKA